jgi:hypothetical protein
VVFVLLGVVLPLLGVVEEEEVLVVVLLDSVVVAT